MGVMLAVRRCDGNLVQTIETPQKEFRTTSLFLQPLMMSEAGIWYEQYEQVMCVSLGLRENMFCRFEIHFIILYILIYPLLEWVINFVVINYHHPFLNIFRSSLHFFFLQFFVKKRKKKFVCDISVWNGWRQYFGH